MAEAILRSKAIAGVAVRSAGVSAVDGLPISTNAKTLIEEAGLPYTPVSNAITVEELEWADLVLTMTMSHKAVLLHSFPEVEAKTFTLKEYATSGEFGDVHDPYGGSLATYRTTFDELGTSIDRLKMKLTEDGA